MSSSFICLSVFPPLCTTIHFSLCPALFYKGFGRKKKILKSSQGEYDEFNFRHDEFAKPVGHPSGDVTQRFQNLVLNAPVCFVSQDCL